MNTLDAPVYLAGLAVLVILGMLVWGYFIARSIERSEAAHMGDALSVSRDETAVEPTQAEML